MEKKPKEYVLSANSPELEKLFETVRMVCSLKEPALPNADYSKKLAQTVADRLSHKTSAKNTKRVWFINLLKKLKAHKRGLNYGNNGQKKWQLRFDQKQAYIFSASA